MEHGAHHKKYGFVVGKPLGAIDFSSEKALFTSGYKSGR
jgi:hypothetical protein